MFARIPSAVERARDRLTDVLRTPQQESTDVPEVGKAERTQHLVGMGWERVPHPVGTEIDGEVVGAMQAPRATGEPAVLVWYRDGYDTTVETEGLAVRDALGEPAANAGFEAFAAGVLELDAEGMCECGAFGVMRSRWLGGAIERCAECSTVRAR